MVNLIKSKKNKILDIEPTFNSKSIDNISQNFRNFTPELVIILRKKADLRNIDFKRGNKLNCQYSDRLNFYINLLIKDNFDVYLAPSINDDFYYLMLSLSDLELHKECNYKNKRLKLIDSFYQEEYEYDNKEKNFEPLRSKQRQEIILEKVNNIVVTLDELKSEGIIIDEFLMHFRNGIQRIKKLWIYRPHWYWPQPLNQLSDYFSESKSLTFASITILKNYLGEKIAFYFAWKSFTSCFFIPLAIPGLIIQIYIIVENEYHSEILPFWVFCVSIWTTIMVEFWKRKSSEINARWGNLDLTTDDSWQTKDIRKAYSGDEMVDWLTKNILIQSITDRNRKNMVFLIFAPIMIICFFIFVGTYFLTKLYKDNYGKEGEYAVLHNIIAGFINGAVIAAIDFFYTMSLRLSVDNENHKYQKDYESSLIWKGFAFKLINSYFAIFAVAFFESGANFNDLFQLLWPIMIYKQAASIGVQVI